VLNPKVFFPILNILFFSFCNGLCCLGFLYVLRRNFFPIVGLNWLCTEPIVQCLLALHLLSLCCPLKGSPHVLEDPCLRLSRSSALTILQVRFLFFVSQRLCRSDALSASLMAVSLFLGARFCREWQCPTIGAVFPKRGETAFFLHLKVQTISRFPVNL